MRITDLICANGISLNNSASSKDEVINLLIDLQKKVDNISNKDTFKKDILSREALGSTGVGNEIAIPHAKSTAVKKAGLVALTLKSGIDYGAPDGNSKLFFMIAAPTSGSDIHIEMLSRLSTLLMDEDFKNKLLSCSSPKEFISQIDKKEAERFSDNSPSEKKEGYRILAVTACPTGIAHTFMAAEALEKAGEKLGVPLKAETNGSGGAKNILTDEEIANADGIIIAADKNVDMSRFDGLPVIVTSVSAGIHDAEHLINRILTGDAPVYHNQNSSSPYKLSGGRAFYRHLMNGVSYMLPFVVGGGILIALSFLIDDYTISAENFGKNTPVAAFFNSIGGVAFGFMLPVLSGFIAMSIADRPALAPGFVGGMLASTGLTFLGTDNVSAGFLGALLAGFVAGYIVLALRKIFENLPKAVSGIAPILIYPLLGILLIGVVMCLVNPFIGMLNTAVTNGLHSMGNTSKILLGAVLGGMMSVDMGGPINKSAYVFGTAAIASGNFDIMAAVMVGGMVPPIAIALCTTFFKSKFTENQRSSSLANYIMGLCFISEGAIPFAAADPLRVLPSCIIGSAVSGALSMFFGCTVRAPHGGIFVFPLVNNIFGYIMALVIGSLVGMLLLAILKGPAKQDKGEI